MKVKMFFTLATVVNLVYGLWYFLAPQGAANVYGFGALYFIVQDRKTSLAG